MMTTYEHARREMVRRHVAPRGVRDPRVLAAVASVPRERFVPAGLVHRAYEGEALPIGAGRTLPHPYLVAHAADLALVGEDDRVLEVGTGSGYGAAVLGVLSKVVYTIEGRPELFHRASRTLREIGARNVLCSLGDGSLGIPEAAPFEVIVVSDAFPEVPPALLDQLAIGGRLVAAVGEAEELERVVRVAPDRFSREPLTDVRFVPRVGAARHA